MNKRPMIRKPVRPQVKSTKKIVKEEAEEIDRSLQAIGQYKTYLSVERNYSPYTVQSYIKDIEDFYTYLKGDNFGNLLTITKGNIPRYYLSYLSTTENLKKKVLLESYLVCVLFIGI